MKENRSKGACCDANLYAQALQITANWLGINIQNETLNFLWSMCLPLSSRQMPDEVDGRVAIATHEWMMTNNALKNFRREFTAISDNFSYNNNHASLKILILPCAYLH